MHDFRDKTFEPTKANRWKVYTIYPADPICRPNSGGRATKICKSRISISRRHREQTQSGPSLFFKTRPTAECSPEIPN